jgi:hypothetical protein
MKNIFNWFLNQKTWVKIVIILLALSFIGMLLPEDPEQVKKEQQQAKDKQKLDSIDKLVYFLKPEKAKKATIDDAFGGFYPPQWIQLTKAVKKEFKYPDETEVDSPKQYGISNIDSGFVWFATEVHSKNGFGVKTTNTLKAQYRMAKDGSGFECYRYSIE